MDAAELSLGAAVHAVAVGTANVRRVAAAAEIFIVAVIKLIMASNYGEGASISTAQSGKRCGRRSKELPATYFLVSPTIILSNLKTTILVLDLQKGLTLGSSTIPTVTNANALIAS